MKEGIRFIGTETFIQNSEQKEKKREKQIGRVWQI